MSQRRAAETPMEEQKAASPPPKASNNPFRDEEANDADISISSYQENTRLLAKTE